MTPDKEILAQQINEITEHHIYARLADISGDEENRKILKRISEDEMRHAAIWQGITKTQAAPRKLIVFLYVSLARILGLSFALKLMEGGEAGAQRFYKRISKKYPQAREIGDDEIKHERQLINLLNDSRLAYAGSIVLGLNDALVELTGTLAGLTFAFQNTRLIGATGLIMGFAASLSMAASGYLSSQEEEGDEKDPVTSAIYTGVAYSLTVVLLVAPYFIFSGIYVAMGVMLAAAVVVILAYTFYISVAKELSFWRRFLQMAAISLGVAVLSFGVGWGIRNFLGIDV